MPPQDIPALREALDGTDFNAIRAGMAALRRLTPHSPDARNAASDVAATAASNRAAVPQGDTTIQRLPNGRYRVHDPATGEEIGQAPNRSAAVRMAQLAAEDTNPPADSGDDDSASNSDSDPADASPDGDTTSPSPDPDMDTTGDATTDPTDGTATDPPSLLKITDSGAATADPAMLTDPAAVAAADPASASAAPADPSATPDPASPAIDPAIDPATIDPDPPAAPKIYNGEIVDAAWYQRKARSATNHPASPVIVLGKWDQDGVSYVTVAENFGIDGEPKATYFQLTDWSELADKLDKDELWQINETFLGQQLLEGKRIYFSHDPRKADGYFKAEVDFLKRKLKITDDDFVKVGNLYTIRK